MTTPRTEHYERSEGPLHLWQPQRRRYSRRTVTIPKGVSPLVRIVFSEMARQGRRYDDVVEASGVLRATIKSWRHKSTPGYASAAAVLNVLGIDLVPVPAVEVIPTDAAADLAALSAKLGKDMPETWAAVVSFAASQQLAREAAAQKLAAIDAETALH